MRLVSTKFILANIDFFQSAYQVGDRDERGQIWVYENSIVSIYSSAPRPCALLG